METDKIKPSTTKAVIVTSIFFLEGIFSYFYHGWAHPALLIFYAILCFNTFFSIQLFDSIVMKNHANQTIVDALLFFFYTTLAWYIDRPKEAMIMVVALFLTATYKYTHMLTHVHHPQLLRRKISVDNAGSAIAFVVCTGILLTGNYSLLWYWTIVFFFANIYLFAFKPLYKI